MTIETRSKYGLEVTVSDGETTIIEDVTIPIYAKDVDGNFIKNVHGFNIREGYKVDERFKDQVIYLLEEIYNVEGKWVGDIMAEWFNNFSSGEKEDFLKQIGIDYEY